MFKTFESTITNEFSDLKTLNNDVRTFLISLESSQKIVYKVNLILEEMITNIIKYGYLDNEPHKISVEIKIDNEYAYLTIIDDANEFDSENYNNPNIDIPLEKMKIGGLGIFLIKSISEHFKYKREDCKNFLNIKLKNDSS